MANAVLAARLAMEATRLEREASTMREATVGTQASHVAAYPAEWEEEEARVWEQAVAFHLEALWQERREQPSILSRVRQETGGRMIAPPTVTREEWRTSAPAHYLRASGMRADDVATCLGFAGEEELRAAIVAEAGPLARAKMDLRPEAERLAWQEPIMEEFAARRADYAGAMEVEAEEGGAMWEAAEAAIRKARELRDTLGAVMGAAGAEVVMAAARVTDSEWDVAAMAAAFTGDGLEAVGQAPSVPAPVAPVAPALPHRTYRTHRNAPGARRVLLAGIAGAAAQVAAVLEGFAQRVGQAA